MSEKTKADTGGPAMPTDHDYNEEHKMFVPSAGMTLLDYFAGRVAITIAKEHNHNPFSYPASEIASRVYIIAAAMVAEKRKREAMQ